MKKILRFLITGFGFKFDLIHDEKELDFFSGHKFSFRDGFTERVTSRLVHKLEKEENPELLGRLSLLLPKLSFVCFGLLLIFGIFLAVLNGGFEPNALFGTETVNENNFISYLILQK